MKAHPPRSAIRIANGAGFWGDNLDAPVNLVRSGEIDVLTLEYLAELTMAILAHQRSKDPNAGYVNDLPDLLSRIATDLKADPALSIVTNAGGLNPSECARRCGSILDQSGLPTRPLAVVSGDDVLPHLKAWSAEGIDLAHMETGEPMGAYLDRFVSANAYLGARPIADALSQGAKLVITGRVADASLTVGPAASHFGWAWEDLPKLAGASVAGHLIECGAQVTGGLWHGWEEVETPEAIGYPIAIVEESGESTITKPTGSGGLVTVGNVAEQLVYEIDDPTRYRTPDLDVDLTTVELTQDGVNRVRVTGATGHPPSGKLKIAAVYRDGWTASGMIVLVGKVAVRNAEAVGRLILDRVKRAGYELAESLIEPLGTGAVLPGIVTTDDTLAEVVLRVTVRDPRKQAVERFCREFAPLVTSGPPGVAGYASGRPSAKPAFAYWPTLIDAGLVPSHLEIREAKAWASEGR